MGGSFNPVHTGHLMVAGYLSQTAGLDEVWLSMSPANPLKPDAHPVSDTHRLAMLRLAVKGSCRLQAIDTELSLPRPSYTLQLLERLQQEHPDCSFRLIIGSDNWQLFDRWHAHDIILQRYGVLIYPRPGYETEPPTHPNATLAIAPTVNISSTFIRKAIARGIDMNYFMPDIVNKYIKENRLYTKG